MGKNPYVLLSDMCHYYDTEEDHKTGLTTCDNCGIPVCSSCIIDGLCLECDDLRGNTDALLMRAFEMEDKYKRVREYERK